MALVQIPTPSGWNPNFQLLNSGGTSLSGATSITISGISDKSELYIFIDSVSSANSDVQFFIRFNSDSTSGNYGRLGWSYNNTTVNMEQDTSTSLLGLGNINTNTHTLSAFIHMWGTNTSGIKPIDLVSTVNAVGVQSIARNARAIYRGTSAISSFTINSNSGNLDNGTIWVYGA